MKHPWAYIFLPLFGGCLANFSPFDEQEFLAAFQGEFCDLYLDCIDGEKDGQWTTKNPTMHRNTCEAWTAEPYNQGCQIHASQALECYEEVLMVKETTSDCSELWSKGTFPSCSATYLNCVTDKPFGSLPTK